MTIWLASYPRSGNTCARIALRYLFGMPSRSIYTEHDMEGLGPVIGALPPEMDVEAASECYFLKTHEMPGEDQLPAIYLVRDGRDTLVSYAHYVLSEERGISPGSDRELFLGTLRELILSRERFGGWGQHVLAWTRRTAPTSVVRIEDLIVRPEQELRRALAAIGGPQLTHTGVLPPSFEKLHKAVPWFFRSGKVGAWPAHMPPYLQALFWEHHGEAMGALGYGQTVSATRNQTET
jgi:hypothetical protein